MTIEEMQAAKREAEAGIAAALDAFMKQTGVRVSDVRFTLIEAQRIDEPHPQYFSTVTMEVRL